MSGMRCPGCREITQTKESRPTTWFGEDAVRRRRYCPSCGKRYTTIELAEGGSAMEQRIKSASRAVDGGIAALTRLRDEIRKVWSR